MSDTLLFPDSVVVLVVEAPPVERMEAWEGEFWRCGAGDVGACVGVEELVVVGGFMEVAIEGIWPGGVDGGGAVAEELDCWSVGGLVSAEWSGAGGVRIIGAGLRLRRVMCGAGGVGVSRPPAGSSVPPMQIKSMPQRRRRMTKMAPLSSCTVTFGCDCLPLFRVRTELPEIEAVDGSRFGDVLDGPWSAHSEAATAACRRRAVAGRLLAWASRLPAGVVNMAEWMCGERLARRNDVTRFVRSSGGGGGICITRDMVRVSLPERCTCEMEGWRIGAVDGMTESWDWEELWPAESVWGRGPVVGRLRVLID
jgi:hypothetical protein